MGTKEMPPKATTQETGSVINKSSITLGTLAKNTGILSAAPNVTRGGRILSYSAAGGLNGFTSGEGPIMWGICSADLSLAELEAYLELEGPLSPSDLVGMEVASRGRNIRVLGTLTFQGDRIDMHNHKMSGLKFAEASETTGGWNTFAYNLGTALTTGAFVEIHERVFVAWNPSG